MSQTIPAASTSYDSYIMDPANPIIGTRQGGRGNASTIVKYADGTEWVFLPNRTKERFLGFLYLQDALKASDKVAPAENKMALNGRHIIYLSRYCGEKKPEFFEHFSKIQTLNEIGFADTGACANLREVDGIIYVFDTEKGSFDRSVHERIDAFVHLHQAIRSVLEERLKPS